MLQRRFAKTGTCSPYCSVLCTVPKKNGEVRLFPLSCVIVQRAISDLDSNVPMSAHALHCYSIGPISFPLSSGRAANKELWDRVIRLTCAVRSEVQESWRPLVETWGEPEVQESCHGGSLPSRPLHRWTRVTRTLGTRLTSAITRALS